MADVKVDPGSLLIGTGVVFAGSISAPNSVVVHGSVQGDITTKKLHVGVNGVVDGLVAATDIDVHGRLGEITTCDNLLRVHQAGVLTGTIEYSELEVLRGGACNGELHRRISVK